MKILDHYSSILKGEILAWKMVLVRGHYKIMEMKRRRKGEKKKIQ
jgi:hypothetical protein